MWYKQILGPAHKWVTNVLDAVEFCNKDPATKDGSPTWGVPRQHQDCRTLFTLFLSHRFLQTFISFYRLRKSGSRWRLGVGNPSSSFFSCSCCYRLFTIFAGHSWRGLNKQDRDIKLTLSRHLEWK